MATEISIRNNPMTFSEIAARIKEGGHGDHHVRLSGDGTTLYVRPSAGGFRNFFTGIKDFFVGADRRQQGFEALRDAIEKEYPGVGLQALTSLNLNGRIRASDLDSLQQTLEKEKALDIARQGLQRPAEPAKVNLVNSLTAAEPDFLHVLIDLAEVHRQGNFFDGYHEDAAVALPKNTRAALEESIRNLPVDRLKLLVDNIRHPVLGAFVEGQMDDAFAPMEINTRLEEAGYITDPSDKPAWVSAYGKCYALKTMVLELQAICLEAAGARGMDTSNEYSRLKEEYDTASVKWNKLADEEVKWKINCRENGGDPEAFPFNRELRELETQTTSMSKRLNAIRDEWGKQDHNIEFYNVLNSSVLLGGDYMEAAVRVRSGMTESFDPGRMMALPSEEIFGSMREPPRNDDVISTTADAPGYSRSADSAADINEESYADGVENQFRQDLEKLKSRPEFKEVAARIEELDGKIQKARENANISEQHRAELISTYRGTRDDLFYKALGKAGI